ncbi:hypothetical protein THRCLA_09933 [Thraustotheca clavata]|uniref:ENTH domain-containing protein n=1 Tax=Thraustotheca clavata TaxID=74557 RepID=A0A1V9YTV8_9STRA|nr:hypothetical protein THRCLA_09933 [Thraustotheca clavata]
MDKNVLARATEDADAPTPGYLYGEIARMTNHSYETCIKVQDYLIGRLKKKQPNIKYKALQVIKQVCREGRGEFRRDMQKHVPLVKEALQFRGPPDPLKGDEYYRRVREAAKECLEAIFDTNTTPAAIAGIQGRIKGVGNPDAMQPQSSGGWSNKLSWGNKEQQPPQNFSNGNFNNGPGQYPGQGGYGGPQGYTGPTPPGQQGYEGPAYPGSTPGGYNGPPYPGAEAPQSYGGPAYPSQHGPPQPYGAQSSHLSGMGNPLFEDKKDRGLFESLKDKATKFRGNEPQVTFAGGPPGCTNPPEGWSYATNRGPTSGPYNPNANSTYNPSEPYRPNSSFAPGYSAPGGYGHDDRTSIVKELTKKGYEGERKKGRVGGAWDAVPAVAPAVPVRKTSASPGDPYRDEGRYSTPDWNNTGSTQPPNSFGYRRPSEPQAPIGQTSGAASDGKYERNVIMALCPPGGMRAVPPKDKLDAFLKSAMTLDAEIVGPILDECLENEAWQVVSKALTVIDGLLNTNGCETFHEYFSDNCDALQAASNSEKSAVRDRAVKILHTLGHAASAPSESKRPSRAPAPRGSTASADLLGGFDEPKPAPQQQQQQSVSLFEGLQAPSSAAPNHAPASAPPAPVQSTTDMFSGLSLGGGEAKPMNPVAAFDPLLQPQQPQQQQAALLAQQQQAMLAQQQQHLMMQQQQMYMQQMQYMQQPMRMGPVMGAAMIPSGYIAKTIQDPNEEANASSGFNFLSQKDSFSFVQDHMKG